MRRQPACCAPLHDSPLHQTEVLPIPVQDSERHMYSLTPQVVTWFVVLAAAGKGVGV
jgi:hypothetical protein